jgi:plastocyanin domain-containing protein
MNKSILIIISLGIIVSLGIIFFRPSENSFNSTKTDSVQNVEIIDGVQYINLSAKGGYSPRISTAKAGIPTKLVVKTKGTFDCSSSLVIRDIGYQKILPQTGEEMIDLGIPKSGLVLQGTCGMGMYSFKLNFI